MIIADPHHIFIEANPNQEASLMCNELVLTEYAQEFRKNEYINNYYFKYSTVTSFSFVIHSTNLKMYMAHRLLSRELKQQNSTQEVGNGSKG